MSNLLGIAEGITNGTKTTERMLKVAYHVDRQEMVITDADLSSTSEKDVIVPLSELRSVLYSMRDFVKSLIVDCSAIDKCDGLFGYMVELTYLRFTDKWNLQNVSAPYALIAGCIKLEDVVCDSWDLGSLKSASWLFTCPADPFITAIVNSERREGHWEDISMYVDFSMTPAGEDVFSRLATGGFNISEDTKKKLQEVVESKRAQYRV